MASRPPEICRRHRRRHSTLSACPRTGARANAAAPHAWPQASERSRYTTPPSFTALPRRHLCRTLDGGTDELLPESDELVDASTVPDRLLRLSALPPRAAAVQGADGAPAQVAALSSRLEAATDERERLQVLEDLQAALASRDALDDEVELGNVARAVLAVVGSTQHGSASGFAETCAALQVLGTIATSEVALRALADAHADQVRLHARPGAFAGLCPEPLHS